MPISLQLKDLIGPIVSLVGAIFSALFFWKNYSLSRQNASRAVYVDGQKFLIEICKQLISEPMLWCIYDDHVLPEEDVEEVKKPLFRAKLEAFAHLHLNMFEMILNEAPNPETGKAWNESNVWINYLHDTLTRSALIREVLEEPGSNRIWSPLLLAKYRDWKDHKER
jgi:hypothetical protein